MTLLIKTKWHILYWQARKRQVSEVCFFYCFLPVNTSYHDSNLVSPQQPPSVGQEASEYSRALCSRHLPRATAQGRACATAPGLLGVTACGPRGSQ